MKSEYEELLEMMRVWHEEIDVTTLIIPYTVHGDWEVEICGYEDYPTLRKLLAEEIKYAKKHLEQFGEVGPITISLVYNDKRGEIYLYFNGEPWDILDESSFS